MANEVYANGREIACKAGDGKSICEFPDVCFTPPQTPATPPGVPIPYPNTGMSKDTTKGTKKVKISKKEVMLKNKSYYKKSMGDEAGCAPKKGIISSTNRGKVYFISWSFDVKFEGKNIDRQLDMTTHNHNPSVGTGSVPTVDVDGMAPQIPVDCDQVKIRFPVESYREQKGKKGPPYDDCQSHHVIQNSHFQYPRGTTLSEICPGYSEGAAPCIPLSDGTDTSTAHGRVSQMQKADAKAHRKEFRESNKSPTYKDARNDAKKQLTAKNPGPGLSDGEAECVLIEVDKKFLDMCPDGMKETSKFKLRPPGQRGKGLPKPPGKIAGSAASQ